MKRVLLFFANGTEEIEALTAVDLLRRAGAEVTLAGVGGKSLTGAHGITVIADTEAEAVTGAFDMVVLPGGMPGTTHLDASETVSRILAETAERGGYLTAICAAPMVLGKRGYLKGKRATCYPSFEKYLEGATLVSEKVCRDGTVITAAGAGVATEFALMLTEALFGKEKASSLRASILA